MSQINYRHARDIDDLTFLRAVATCQPSTPHGPGWAMRSDVERQLGGLPFGPDAPWVDEVPGVPWKVVLAKFRRVNGRGLVNGCDCGCRGDWYLTDKGRQLLAEEQP